MRVAVIGAGISGVTSAKCLIEAGLEPVVFEQGTTLGGIWRYDETLPDGGGPAYRGLRTNTPKQTTAFSDFPFPAHLPDYPPRSAMLHYLDDYADHFRVYEHIRFETEVIAVTPEAAGRWTVVSKTANEQRSETFDAVMICSGVFRDPVLPDMPGLETFTGTILHSRAYTVPEHFTDQDVLVVGGGSSAIDVAVEASAVACHVWLSVRGWTPAQPVTRAGAYASTMRSWRDRALPPRVRQRLARRIRFARGWGRSGPDAPLVPGITPFVPGPKLRAPLAEGRVTLASGITALDGDHVVFTDGTRQHIDTIVFATGYALTFPFLDTAIFQPSMSGLDLYRLIFPPDWPTLAFIGMFRVSGPAPPVAEMQARWAVEVLRGTVHLPPPDAMRAAITARHTLLAQTGGNPFRLNAEAYEDLLASEIGVLPRLWRHPRLWRAIVAGPSIAAQYRLDGPHHWSGAAEAVIDAQRPPADITAPLPEPVVVLPTDGA